jgi:glutathione S-transferase
MDELWQTEWCPASRRVRQRLTELGVDYVARQVPVEKAARTQLRARAGTDTIPVLVAAGGEAFVGEDAILAQLATREADPAESDRQRTKAETAHRRQLEEECECPPSPPTR